MCIVLLDGEEVALVEAVTALAVTCVSPAPLGNY